MIISLAPMEGVTGHIFRRVHARCFGVLDRYYTPFIAPPRVGSNFGVRIQKEIDPKQNKGLNVIPQLLTKHSGEFVWAAELLANLGYKEVNLNLGCPSGTVVGKGRGSGFLQNLNDLEVFLEDICEKSPLPVSVKTRLGLTSDEEYERILSLYCRFPLTELIVHPRVQKDGYEGRPRWEAYRKTLEHASFSVAYNGDIFSPADYDALLVAFPTTQHVMLGRGIVANPALARMLLGGDSLTLGELKHFHDELFDAYEAEIGNNAVWRMKEWWSYAMYVFTQPMAVHRKVRKTRKIEEYKAAVEYIFNVEILGQDTFYPGFKTQS